jgi:hypothetical protein
MRLLPVKHEAAGKVSLCQFDCTENHFSERSAGPCQLA